ncbi:MAG: hypothetical protein ACKPKO_52605 [Candidatus Fonsibacter sp.]
MVEPILLIVKLFIMFVDRFYNTGTNAYLKNPNTASGMKAL